ncbi:MAG: tRNA 2-thiocytidine biosynthesis TtcA family protein [Anaeroplasmataceae bacterium]
MSVKENFERDIIKKYRSVLWAKFIRAIQDYKMIEPNDKVCVAISGGKDSLLLAKLMQEVSIHGNFPFEIEFVAMNPGFTEANKELLLKNCELLGIPVKLMDSNVFEVANKMMPEKPCYMCARMRRGFLYARAKELGCNKLALGHHFNDVIETTLMNILYAGCFKTMVPKVKAENFDDIELIRPMVYIKEKDIKRIMKNNGIETMNCGCKVASGEIPSKRKEVKELIAKLCEDNKVIDQNIFMSAANVNLTGILGYKTDEEFFDFNDIYEGVDKK